MRLEYSVLVKMVAIVLLLSFCLNGCVIQQNEPSELDKNLRFFSEHIKHGDFNNLKLTIYYIDPEVLTRAPLSVTDLMRFNELQRKKTFNGLSLLPYVDLLGQLNVDNIQIAKSHSNLDARLYFVFEEEDQKILDITIGFSTDGIYISGIEVKRNDIFYNIIETFLGNEIATAYWTK